MHRILVVSSFFSPPPHRFPCLQWRNAPAALSGPFIRWGNSSYKAVLLDCHLHSMNSAFKTPWGIYLLFYCERKKTTPNWTESSPLLLDRNKRWSRNIKEERNLTAPRLKLRQCFGAAGVPWTYIRITAHWRVKRLGHIDKASGEMGGETGKGVIAPWRSEESNLGAIKRWGLRAALWFACKSRRQVEESH